MAQIRFSVDGDVQLSRNLRVFAENVKDMKEFMGEALDIVEKRSDSLFARKGSNTQKNPKWKPLAKSTKLARQKRWGYYKKPPKNPSTLRWTGNLQDNKTKAVSDKSGMLAFNADYGIHHQRGGQNLPKRAVIDLSNETNSEMIRALQKKVERDIGVFGLQA